MQRVLDNLPIVLVMAAALLMVGYAGYGEAKRVAPRLEMEQLAIQGEILRDPIETFLFAGLPLDQFVGLSSRAHALMASDPQIDSVTLIDPAGRTIIRVGAPPGDEAFASADVALGQTGQRVTRSDSHYRVHLPLTSRFGPAGKLRLTTPAATVDGPVYAAFAPIVWVGAGCLAAFIILVALADTVLQRHRKPLVQGGFVLLFLTMSAAVLAMNFTLFSEGVQSRTQSMALAMAERLSEVHTLGLDLSTLNGIEHAFERYMRINPDISAIVLLSEGVATIHSDASLMGEVHTTAPNVIEYRVQAGEEDGGRLFVAVEIPIDVVMREIWRSGKNLLVLLFATGLIGLLFLDVGTALERRQRNESRTLPGAHAPGETLTLIRPAYFLVVFIEMLSVSFLPQMVSLAAERADLSADMVPLPFTGYFLCFTLGVLGATPLVQRLGLKSLIGLGTLLSTLGLFAIAVLPDYGVILAGRAVSGLGQGALLVGVQSYLLAAVPVERRTQAAAVQVIAFNGALISGSAIGALLAVYFGPAEVFAIAGGLGVATMLYLWLAVPGLEPARTPTESERRDSVGFVSGLGRVLRDREFLSALVLVGIFSKIVLAGVVMFALPLILSRLDMPQEDIGQILMLYAAAGLFSARFGAPVVDHLRNARLTLLGAGIAAGLGMVLVGLITRNPDLALDLAPLVGADTAGWLAGMVTDFNTWLAGLSLPAAETLVLAIGVLTMGAAQGLIAAPIITQVGETPAGRAIGTLQAAAHYRLLERVGHVLGPLVVGQILVLTQYSSVTVAVFGVLSVVFSVLFLILSVPAGRKQARG